MVCGSVVMLVLNFWLYMWETRAWVSGLCGKRGSLFCVLVDILVLLGLNIRISEFQFSVCGETRVSGGISFEGIT